MKSLILIAFSVFSSLAGAQILSTYSGELADVQFSGKTFNKEATVALIRQHRETKKALIQGILDENHTGAEVLWQAKGTLDQIYKEVSSTNSSWIWSEAVPGKVSAKMYLNADGSGTIDLIQEGKIVGHVRCQSSAIRNGPGSQPKAGITKIWDKDADHVSTSGVKMPNALFIDDPERMIAMHGGSLASKSGGCPRVGTLSAKHLFRLLKEGSTVEVIRN